MLDYLDGQRLWDLIEDDIYKQVEDIMLNLDIDDLITVFTADEENVPEIIKQDCDLYLLGEVELTEEEMRRHIWDLVSNNWDLGLKDDVLYDHENRFDIYEIGKVIKEIKMIQDALGIQY